MRLSTLLYFYGRRLRTHPVQEALAGLGIAVGVALVFAVQVANSSITDGSSQVVHSIVGAANLQVRARDPSGFDEGMVDRIRRLPNVEQAAGLLDINATAQGPDGRSVPVQLASASVTLAALDGLAQAVPAERLQANTVMLPRATANALGASTTAGSVISKPLPNIAVRVRGKVTRLGVSAVLGAETVGALSNAMAVIVPLSLIQRIGDLPGRVNRVLLEAEPGKEAIVRRELERLTEGRMTVASATDDVRLLKQATIPNGNATGFFAFVSALVGLLLAFNAMLLSAPERRRVIADLRIQGAKPRDLVKLLLFQALCLGVVASLVGVVVGDILSRGTFRQTPGYLAAAFPLGTQTVIGWTPVVLSVLGGVLATCLAAAPPLLDLRRSRAVDAVYIEAGEPGHAMPARVRVRLFAGAVLLVAITSGLLLIDRSAVIVTTLGLALAMLLAIPFCFTLIIGMAQSLAVHTGRLNMLLIAVRALRATTVRSLALAATGAIAVFGSVVAEGSHNDLLHGLYRDYSQYVSTAPLWVTNPGDELATDSFPARGLPARIARVPGVASVRTYQGGFLDLPDRRVWVIARSPSAPAMFPTAQTIDGNPLVATERLRQGGWVTVSQQVAEKYGVKPGGAITLPTPAGPTRYRVAATTTNLGWASGAIVLNSADYRKAWGTADPTALEVAIKSGAGTTVVKHALERTIGTGGGLRVQTNLGRAALADTLAREGLSRLTQISLLLMIAAALSMAAAMGASIWQRRPSLASLRIQSYRPGQLRQVLLYECCLVLITGCLIGLAAGVYGHLLSDHFLRLTTGFPAPFSPGTPHLIQTVVIVLLASLIVLVAPGYVASEVPPALALQD